MYGPKISFGPLKATADKAPGGNEFDTPDRGKSCLAASSSWGLPALPGPPKLIAAPRQPPPLFSHGRLPCASLCLDVSVFKSLFPFFYENTSHGGLKPTLIQETSS